MGTFSTQVSKQASSSQAGSATQEQIIMAAGTSTVPVNQNIATDFERLNPGVKVNIQGTESRWACSPSLLALPTLGERHPTSQVYQNLYFTQIGGRGVVFIQDASKSAVPGNIVDPSALEQAYAQGSANGNGVLTAQVTSALHPLVTISSGTTVEERETGTETMVIAFSYMGGAAAATNPNGLTEIPRNDGNAQMLAAVQAGTSSEPVIGFVDSGYAITGGLGSNTSAPGISILSVYGSNGNTYAPTHANIENALHDWYYSNTQDTTGGHTGNYPQNLVNGLYYVTQGTTPSTFNGNQIQGGASAASSTVTGFIRFAKSPGEEPAFTNAGVYSMYDFI